MMRQRTVTPLPPTAPDIPLLESSDLPLDEDWSLLSGWPDGDDDVEISFSPDPD